MFVYDDFPLRLLVVVPELAPVYAGHIDDYDDVMPHVLMGDVTRFAITLHGAAKEDLVAAEVLGRLLALLERGLVEGAESVKEPVGASFVENLHQADAEYAAIVDRLGPTLTAAAAALTR